MQLGADYVQLMTVTEPHSEHGCFDNRFVMRGVAFRSPTGLAPPPPPMSAGPAAPARCKAEDLPEWKDADAYAKKQLLAKCRAPASSPAP